MNKYHDTKGRFASQKVYAKGKYYTTIYPENTVFQVFFKKYSILLMVILVLSSGLYLQFKKPVQSRYCTLSFVTCE